MRRILVLRPQPGADATAVQARKLGLEPVVTPLFTIRPVAWTPPDPAGFDAVMLSSANAARHAGDGLTPFLSLPCYAVGGPSAAAARTAGFSETRIGPGDGQALLTMMAADGIARAFHPCGREVIPLVHQAVEVTRVAVYVADAAEQLPAEAVQALEDGAVVLIHSPRAGAILAELAGERRSGARLAAISTAAAEAAGAGWQEVSVASVPRDLALLELAARLCQT